MRQQPTRYIVTTIPPHNDKLDTPVIVGETLYTLMKNDYGGSSLDTDLLGTECISVTSKSNGDYPYITMPLNCIKASPHYPVPLLKVFNKNHPLYKRVHYDIESREYYDSRTDIFLSDEDIVHWLLRPYSLIPNPLPHPLPTEYFISWTTYDASIPPVS